MSGTQTFDNRLLQVQVVISGQLMTFNQDAWIKAKGTKFANALQNEATVEIANLDRTTRDNLLTETSPFNKNRVPKVVNISAGRVSTGLTLLYVGDVQYCKITQPPDVVISLKCGTGHFKKGRVASRTGGKLSTLNTLATQVASDLQIGLRNEAPNNAIGNYAYSGNTLDEIDNLANNGNCQGFLDDNTLVLKPVNVPLSGELVTLDYTNGMIGAPEITDKGMKVKFLFNPAAKLGGGLQVTSQLNPAANGTYVIYKLEFELASRETEFYYIAECLRVAT